ncbi:autotransporter domain-containing protein [Sphingomonas sp.]|uniref:autotransporter domain-containing protein n=1 Tax=Sphingomonas sp. TaxID=28214 RepID=UPI00286DADFB|nr:autotransporter domain-containing protein [Sphingomonas sp.]
MLYRRLPGRALIGASAIALASLATPAAAQRVDHIVAFGDSYADQDNLFALIGQPCPAVYSTCRFSGGTNYIDTLSLLLGVPVDNFAIGGALTSNNNTVAGPGVLGFPTEYGAFLAGGGGGAFPTVSGSFDADDLVTVSIGGNDARLYQQNGGTLAGVPAAAVASAAQATAGLNALVGAGAETISFLAGNTSFLPELALEPDPAAAAAVRNAYSTTFNAAIQSTLAGYAANGVTVHYLDLTLVRDQIVANPAAYGFASTGACPVAEATQCVTNPAFANQYLLYVDGIHLTSAGFAVVARYIQTQLTAPLTLQGSSELGLETARQFGRTLSSRLDTSAPRDGDTADGLQFFVAGDMASRDGEQTRSTDAFDYDSVGATAGLRYGMGNAVVGLAANLSKPELRFIGGSADTRTTSLQLGAFAGYAIAGAFVQGYAGYGHDKHKIDRDGVVQDMSAKPDGNHWLAGAKAGYLMPLGSWRAGPVVALDYAKAKVDDYSERGDPALSLDVGELSSKALTGSLGLEARGDFDSGGLSFRPFVAAAMEKTLSGNGDTAFYAQHSSPTIVNSWRLSDRSKKAYARLTGGASAALFGTASLDATVSSTFGRNDGDDISAQIGLRIGM